MPVTSQRHRFRVLATGKRIILCQRKLIGIRNADPVLVGLVMLAHAASRGETSLLQSLCLIVATSCPPEHIDSLLQHPLSLELLSTGEALDVQPPSTAVEQEDTAAEPPEEVLFEGNGAPAELLISIILAGTILYIPLTIGAIGRRLWIKYRFTNKRFSIINTSPLFKKQVTRHSQALGSCF